MALLALLPRVGEGVTLVRNILGVDIGSKGGLALLSPDGEPVEVIDMPTLADGPARRPAVNAALEKAGVVFAENGMVGIKTEILEFSAANPRGSRA